jgi:hypothetical protein
VGPASATDKGGEKIFDGCVIQSSILDGRRRREQQMATAAVTMTMATHNPRARAPLRICAAWDMNPGAATVATPKPSKAKAKPPPPPATTTPARPPPLTHADLFARSSEAQGIVSCPHHMPRALLGGLKFLRFCVLCACSK